MIGRTPLQSCFNNCIQTPEPIYKQPVSILGESFGKYRRTPLPVLRIPISGGCSTLVFFTMTAWSPPGWAEGFTTGTNKFS